MPTNVINLPDPEEVEVAYHTEFEHIPKLPTLETQFLAWLHWASRWWNVKKPNGGVFNTYTALQTNSLQGYKLVVRLSPVLYDNRPLMLVWLVNLCIPDEDRSRGWFDLFCELALRLMPFDGLYHETASHQLAQHLEKMGCLKTDQERCYVQLKNSVSPIDLSLELRGFVNNS